MVKGSCASGKGRRRGTNGSGQAEENYIRRIATGGKDVSIATKGGKTGNQEEKHSALNA